MSEPDFLSVTELAGDEVSQEQVERICHRYYWAGQYCQGKNVLEVACGTGQGVGYLAGLANSVQAGDYSAPMLEIARNHYGDRFEFIQFDAQAMPFDDNSIDVVIIFEASYYLPQPEKFVQECARVLRPEGMVLLATANKDLFDFNPSPFSYSYHGTVELQKLFAEAGFSVECFGYMPVDELTLKQKILRPIKKFAVEMGLIPKTMAGKKLLKKLVFGGLVKMPAEIACDMFAYQAPTRLDTSAADTKHKVIYCAARKLKG